MKPSLLKLEHKATQRNAASYKSLGVSGTIMKNNNNNNNNNNKIAWPK